MSIYKKLLDIQTELKAPKNQYNGFGKYNYRSCEDILEALKPVCAKHGAVCVVKDTVLLLGDRHYIQATAYLIDVETGESVESTALAREEESKKGMDSSQLTGSTSSYARKYALNGLYCIDDTKDSDSTNTHGKQQDKPKAAGNKQTNKDEVINDAQLRLLKTVGKNAVAAKAILKEFGYNSSKEILTKDFNKILERIKNDAN